MSRISTRFNTTIRINLSKPNQHPSQDLGMVNSLNHAQ